MNEDIFTKLVAGLHAGTIAPNVIKVYDTENSAVYSVSGVQGDIEEDEEGIEFDEASLTLSLQFLGSPDRENLVESITEENMERFALIEESFQNLNPHTFAALVQLKSDIGKLSSKFNF